YPPLPCSLNRMQADELQAGGLGEAVADVHGLHGLARGALHQVVDRSGDDHAVGVRVNFEADVAEIGAGEDRRFRRAVDAGALLDNADEGLLAVDRAVDAPQVAVSHGLLREDVTGRQDTAHGLDAGGREADLGRVTVDLQLLDDLGGVAVPGTLEGPNDASALRMVAAGAGRTAAARRAGLGLDDDRHLRVGQPALDQRVERQDAGGRHAARAGDVVGVAD